MKEMLNGFFCFLWILFKNCQKKFLKLKFEGDLQYQCFDSQRLKLIAKMLPKNPVIFEAGSNDGTDTIKIHKMWPNSKIIAMEADPYNFKRFLKNTQKYPNIQGYQLAVNTFSGSVKFNISKFNRNIGSLLKPPSGLGFFLRNQQIDIPCENLDQWCKDNQIDHIDFMWLDLEGIELQILQSSPSILKTVKVIYTETRLKSVRSKTSLYVPLRSFLESEGFELKAHWYTQNFIGDAIFQRLC